MHNHRRRSLNAASLAFASSLLIMVATPASAQDGTGEGPLPTVEGAHRFLGQLVNTGLRIQLLRDGNGLPFSWKQGFPVEITSYAMVDKCTSRFGYRLDANEGVRGPGIQRPASVGVFDIHWQKAKSIDSINIVYMATGQHWEAFAFNPGPDYERRLGAAMEFIRSNCDPTAKTGF